MSETENDDSGKYEVMCEYVRDVFPTSEYLLINHSNNIEVKSGGRTGALEMDEGPA